MTDTPAPAASSAYALLRERDYMLMWLGRFCGVLGITGQSVTMLWQVYDVARADATVSQAAFYVGLLGLASFMPLFCLALPAGETADRYSRRFIVFVSYLGEIACAGVLLWAAVTGNSSVGLLIGVAFAFGIARAFSGPAGAALGPMLVPRHLLARAIAWSTLSYQFATIMGPALVGHLIAFSVAHAYGASIVLYAVSAILLLGIRKPTRPESKPGSRLALMKEGLQYVWKSKIVLGATSLDLFAVLFGGVTALLPVFARDVLHAGEEGYGYLRAAPAVGAAVVSLVVSVWTPRRRAGLVMFAGVAVYGLLTVVFGLSRHFWLSFAALVVLGGADMLSVYVRQTLIQIVTPDAMRGRVSAVASLFVGASNELGAFESGVVARLIGPVGSAVFGGIASLGITGVWAILFPSLRKVDKLG